MEYADMHLLPKASFYDPVAIRGNLTLEQKQLVANVGEMGWQRKTYSDDVVKKIRTTDVNVWDDEEGGDVRAEAVCEVEVDKTMTNAVGILHGACIAYLVDMCSSITFVVYAVHRKTGGLGLSQSMSIQYHSPASIGATLRIVSNTVMPSGRRMLARCEAWDKESKTLIFSAEHVRVRSMRPRKLANL